ncbi:hypothetical protein QGN29_10085 [Temperatibacter marinus]|uniref:EF-hand domain-containing protein n=1 Tax=Temperatibacter marinus TaxID=1456591 RepID=A0AA52EFJ0_9PROT|nr:hypothetical protein [Temperatibacter marinus]WND01900.1 hypothetical protein QGN29_10085 [Temperatibacter marinus]
MAKRPEKKSETIEVRVSHSEKSAFMEASKKAGITASESIRTHISHSLDEKKMNRRKRLPFFLCLSGLTALLLAYYLYRLPVNDKPLSNAQKVFTYFDQNKDGLLSIKDLKNIPAEENQALSWLINAADANQDGLLSPTEFTGYSTILIELNQSKAHSDYAPSTRKEKVIIIPPHLSPEERKAFLEKYSKDAALKAETLEKLQKLLNAISQ